LGYSQSLSGSGLQEQDWLHGFSAIGLNPLRSWWFLGLSWGEGFSGVGRGGERLENALPATLAGLSVFCAAACVLWLAACRRFRQEEGAGTR